MRPPQPALFHWALATGHESPGRAQLACSIARVAGCLHTDVSSPWLTHDWSDVRWDFDLRQAVGVGGLTAAAGIAIRSASCQQPRVAARWRSSSDWPFAPSLDGVTAHPTCAAPAAPAAPAVSLLLSRTSLAARGLCAAPSRTRAHANNARTWLRRLVAALL